MQLHHAYVLKYSFARWQMVVSHECASSANFRGVTFPTFDTANPREIPRVHVDVYARGGVHNSGFSVALGRLSLRIVVPRAARDTAATGPAVRRDLWTSIRGWVMRDVSPPIIITSCYCGDPKRQWFLSWLLPSFLLHPSSSVSSYSRRSVHPSDHTSLRDDNSQDFLIY